MYTAMGVYERDIKTKNDQDWKPCPINWGLAHVLATSDFILTLLASFNSFLVQQPLCSYIAQHTRFSFNIAWYLLFSPFFLTLAFQHRYSSLKHREKVMDSMKPQEHPQPWIETPLIESAALSKAAGWYVLKDTFLNPPSLGSHP